MFLMSHPDLVYRIFPLGDAAITVDFGNCIDEAINKEVIARFEQLQEQPLPGMLEVVPAYSSITIFYDPSGLRKKIPSKLKGLLCPNNSFHLKGRCLAVSRKKPLEESPFSVCPDG